MPPRTVQVTKETIAGVLILGSEAVRNNTRNIITNYLDRPRVNVVPSSPALIDENSNKYGPGFGLIVRAEFVTKADADAVWADVAANLAVLSNGSFVDQYTSSEDQETGQNNVTYHHRQHVPGRPEDF